MSKDQRPGINWVQVTAAALAAVSSAVVLSTLGVAGTIIGAALGSVTASLGAAIYSRTIDASRQQVAAQAAALKRVAHARNEVDDAVSVMRRGGAESNTGVMQAQAKLSEAEQALQEAEADVERSTEASGPGGGPPEDPERIAEEDAARDALVPAEAGKRLPWKRVALVAAAVFLIAMVAITAFELVTGRAVSSYTGGSSSNTGTTVPGLGGGKSSKAPTPTPTPTQQPTQQPTQSQQPSPSSPGSSSPSPSVVPTPTPSPSGTPYPSGTPSPSSSLPIG